MRIAFVTDVHFGPDARYDGQLRKLSQQAPRLLAATLEQIEAAKPDLVVNLGDVVQDESPEADRAAYTAFLDVMARCSAPVLHVAGNHDLVHAIPAELGARWGRTDGACHYAVDHGDLHFIVLRSDMTETVNLAPEQLAFLEQALAATQRRTVVLVHHPLGDMDVSANRWFYRQPELCHVQERSAARAIIERSGKVVAVFNGHVHWNHLAVHAGIPYVTVQSMIENLDADAPGRPSRAWALATVKPQSVLVELFGEHEGRYELALPRGAAA